MWRPSGTAQDHTKSGCTMCPTSAATSSSLVEGGVTIFGSINTITEREYFTARVEEEFERGERESDATELRA